MTKEVKNFVCKRPSCRWGFIEMSVPPETKEIICGCGAKIREEVSDEAND